MIRFGVIGLGRMGEIHARNIVSHTHALLSALFDTDPDKGAVAAERCGCRAVSSVEVMLADSSIDARLTRRNSTILSNA